MWVNGRLVEGTHPALDARDRGFTLGDGVFETMRAGARGVFAHDRHLRRLVAGALVLGVSLPPVADLEQLITRALVDVAPGQWVTLRLSVSRGVPRRRGLLPEAEAQPTIVLHRMPFVPYSVRLYQSGMTAIVSTLMRNERSPLANIKSLSYLDNVLARQEAAPHGADEALLCNTRGDLVCASAMNLFAVFGTTLVTPPVASGALSGTVRALVLDNLAREVGLEVIEQPITLGDFVNCQEAFLTNALAGVVPLVRVDQRPIGTGRPGGWTIELHARLSVAWATHLLEES